VSALLPDLLRVGSRLASEWPAEPTDHQEVTVATGFHLDALAYGGSECLDVLDLAVLLKLL
jgi:hypothetical protein